MNADMNGNEESPPAAHGVGQDTAPLEEETPEEFDIPMFSQQQERLQPMDLGGYSYDLNSRVAATTTAADQADGPSTSGQPPAQQSQQHPPRPRVNTRRTGQAAGRGSQAASAAHNGGGAGGAASLAAASARAPAGSGSGRSSRGKIFSDPVHKTFRLDPVAVKVIDTPQFQRLRNLKQLGLTDLVFPTAVHSRFEHSLGVAYKAYEVADRIYRTQAGPSGDVSMDLRDVRNVGLAGLCHDLGHGPFSHVFEREFLPRRGKKEWHHEVMSERMLDYLLEDNSIEEITREDAALIKDLIRGDPHADGGSLRTPPGRRFLYDIVANHRNGVDVDKVDYLQRDALQCAVNIGCDFQRLLQLTKVLDDQICYKWSEYSNLRDLFHARESLHRRVYTHRKTKAVEFMVCDALVHADLALGFTDDIANPRHYMKLNDSILNTVENFGLFNSALDNGADASLRTAQGILAALRRRELYAYANQFTVPPEYIMDGRWDRMASEFTAESVASYYGGSDVRLAPDDLILHVNKIDHGLGRSNPLDQIRFFDDFDDTASFNIGRHQVLGIMPLTNQERVLRVYTRQRDPRYRQAAREALEGWCRRRFGQLAEMATPARPSRRPPGTAGQGPAGAREAAIADADPRRGQPPRPPGSGTATAGTAVHPAGATCGSQDPGTQPLPALGTNGSVAGGAAEGSTCQEATAGGYDPGVGGAGSGAYGTPTRSSAARAAAAIEGAGPEAAAGDGGGETGGRSAKRQRSAASLFDKA